MFSLRLAFCLAGLAPFVSNEVHGASVKYIDMADICQSLTQTLNTISSLLKFEIDFEGGQILGEERYYPSGKVFLDPNAERLENCNAYTISEDGIRQAGNSTNAIVHIEFQDSIIIQFEPTMYEGNMLDLHLKVDKSVFVLHYHIHKTPAGKLELNSILGEIQSLGSVSLNSTEGTLGGTTITTQAEDIIRPKLFTGFNWFAQKYLAWILDPSEESLDGLNAMKYIFRGTMTNLKETF